MLRGIYSAANAMNVSMQKMNLFAQNVSNSQTTGYKKKTYAVHSFEDMLVNVPDPNSVKRKQESLPVATGSYIDSAGVRQKQGRLRQTGNVLDLAIKGEGIYFQLEVNNNQRPEGTPTKYTTTRDGHFMIDQNNYLTNNTGDYVLDSNNQRIRLMLDNPNTRAPVDPNRQVPSLTSNLIKIDTKGQIFDTRRPDAPLAQIKMVEYNADPTQANDRGEMMAILRKYGLEVSNDSALLDNYALPTTPDGQPRVNVMQGYVEESNVDITSEMIAMMMTSKDYDMSQKIISTEDKVLDKTINEMGRLQ